MPNKFIEAVDRLDRWFLSDVPTAFRRTALVMWGIGFVSSASEAWFGALVTHFQSWMNGASLLTARVALAGTIWALFFLLGATIALLGVQLARGAAASVAAANADQLVAAQAAVIEERRQKEAARVSEQNAVTHEQNAVTQGKLAAIRFLKARPPRKIRLDWEPG